MALLISMVTVLALGQTVKIVDQVNQRALDMPTDWYLFVTELELSDRHFSLYRCQDEQHAVLYGAATKKYYELTAENGRIFLRLQHGGGYLPMLYQVQTATFKQLGRQRLEIEVKRSNGYQQTAVICLAPSQSSTLLAAMIMLSITTAAVLAQYRYQAGQAKLIHRLSDQFVAQTMLNLTDGKDNADFNKGIVKHEDRLTIVCLNDGSSFKFQEDEALP